MPTRPDTVVVLSSPVTNSTACARGAFVRRVNVGIVGSRPFCKVDGARSWSSRDRARADSASVFRRNRARRWRSWRSRQRVCFDMASFAQMAATPAACDQVERERA